MKKLFIFFEFFSIILFLIGIVSLGFVLKEKIGEYRHSYRLGNNIVYRASDVLGISTDKATVTIDFSKQIATGSPLIFGGSHAPRLDHEDAWKKIRDIGVTSIRRDFAINWELPNNITLNDYLTNKNNIQDPKNWNKNKIDEANNYFKKAKDLGMSVIGIVSFAPKWLTYSGTDFGVPKNWEVFEDLVSKSYKLHRQYVDYVEIWNEPNYPIFLNLTGSNLSREEAYYQMFQHATKALRKVDQEINDGKKIKIGAPATSDPIASTILEKILIDPVTRQNLDFISYHNYEQVKEPSWNNYQKLLAKYKLNYPIFITEWSFSYKLKEPNPYVLTNLGIPYVGSKLVTYLQMGVSGANYYSLQPIVDNSPYGSEGYLGMYYWLNNTAELLPQAKTWRLMSRTLSLGEGSSKIFQNSDASLGTSLGFQNSHQTYGVVIVNSESSTREISVNLKNIPLKTAIFARAYVASENFDGSIVVGTNKLSNGPNISFKVATPAKSVVGITLTGDATLEEKVKSIFVP